MSAPFSSAAGDFEWLLRHVSPPPRDGEFDIDTIAQLLEEAARFIGDVIAPLRAPGDEAGPRLENGRVKTAPGWREAYDAWREGGWQGLNAPVDHGGMGAPAAVQAAVTAMMAAADVSFAMLPGGSRAAATLLNLHADEETKARCLPMLASGEWSATIVVTEAGAGTDVGQIRTRAAKGGEGRYALSGSKIFISNGDHDLTDQILHLVLARIEGAPAGSRGLSLFLVPMWKDFFGDAAGAANGVWVSALEEKMGLHASPTCVLNFDGAEGLLIGAEGGGLAAMFAMMNEMRLDVGLIAVGVMQGAFAHAQAYAQERRQGRTAAGAPAVLADHPDVRRMLSIMAANAEGGRALAMEIGRLIDLAEHGDGTAARLAALLTPVAKAGLSDRAVETASLGVQIFGGHGYVRETGAEQYLRDARVLPLYEGANGVQAVDLAVRKLQKDNGAGFADLIAAMQADIARLDERAELEAIREALAVTVTELSLAVRELAASEAGGPAALAAAWPLLELTTHACLVWMWLRMAGADAPAGDPALARKQALARFVAAYDGGRALGLGMRLRDALDAPDLYDAGVIA